MSKIFELAAGGEIFGQQLVDFVVEDEPFFFARFHEMFQPTEFVICCHWHPAYQRNLILLRDPTAATMPVPEAPRNRAT